MSSSETSLLVQRARTGDQAAWAEVDRRFRPLLDRAMSAALRNQIGARLESEDVVQSALLQAWTSLDGYEDRGPGSFALWLNLIALNRLRDNLRKHLSIKRDAKRTEHRDRSASLDHLQTAEPSPSEVFARAESYLELLDALQTLGELPRAVVHLRDISREDWSFIESALGLSPSDARRIHARAFGALKKALKHLRED